MNREPYFMQKIHEQREKDSRVLYSKFKGNIERWLDWMEQKNAKNLARDQGKEKYEIC